LSRRILGDVAWQRHLEEMGSRSWAVTIVLQSCHELESRFKK
jgi:hypothetical protein